MPTTSIAVQDWPGFYSTTGTDLTTTAADTTNGNHITIGSQGVMLLAHNTGASTRTVTVTSVADPTFGRRGDISAVNITAGTKKVVFLTKTGWADTNNQVAFSANHAEVVFSAVKLLGG
jgi:hypothetical protein